MSTSSSIGFTYQELDREMERQLAEGDLGSHVLSIPCVGPASASLLSGTMGMARYRPKILRHFLKTEG